MSHMRNDMDEGAIQSRLKAIERRQSLALTLLVGLYILGGLWVVVHEIAAVTVWEVVVGAIVLGVFASAVGIYRRRKARG